MQREIFSFVISAKEGERKAFAWFNFSTLCHCTNVFVLLFFSFSFFGLAMFWHFFCARCLFVGVFFPTLIRFCWLPFSTLLQLPPIALSLSLSLFLASSCSSPLTCCAIYKECVVACCRAILFHLLIFVVLFGFLLCYLHWCHRFVHPIPFAPFPSTWHFATNFEMVYLVYK